MKVNDAILQRHSIRAFKPTDVPKALIREILNIAKYAPSSTNIQPWEVHVVSGKTKEALSAHLLKAVENKEDKTPDYDIYPKTWTEPYISRRKALGAELYRILDIDRDDKAKQKAQWLKNYHAFGAPTIVFILTDNVLSESSLIDCGSFMQSFMLACLQKELATCPQAAFVEYAGTIKSFLNIPADKKLIVGIAVGYPESTPENAFKSQRAELDEFVTHHD